MIRNPQKRASIEDIIKLGELIKAREIDMNSQEVKDRIAKTLQAQQKCLDLLKFDPKVLEMRMTI